MDLLDATTLVLPIVDVLAMLSTNTMLNKYSRYMLQIDSFLFLLLGSWAYSGAGRWTRFRRSYDHAQWQLATPNEAVGKVEIVDDALFITAPPADKVRPQIGNHGKFSNDVDLEISMDFELWAPLPEATQDDINLELIVTGIDGIAHLSRTNHNEVVAYFKPSSESGKSVWKHSPTSEKSGTLKLVRQQDQLAFLFQTADGSHQESVATASFGPGPIHKVSVALSVSSPTKETLKVRVDNLRVKSGSEDGSWLVSAIVWLMPGVFLILGGVAFWLWKTGKLSQPPSATAEDETT